MLERSETCNNPLLIVAGANAAPPKTIGFESWFNPWTIIESMCASSTERLYRPLAHVALKNGVHLPQALIIPKMNYLSVGCSWEKIYAEAEKEIDDKIKRNYEGQRVLLVGHSVGGCIAARYAQSRPEEVSCVVTVAAPHEGVGGDVVGLLGLWGWPISQFNDSLRSNSNEVRALREQQGEDAPPMIMIASISDEIVPVSSALPSIDRTKAILLTDNRSSSGTQNPSWQYVEAYSPPRHASTISHPETLKLIAQVMEPIAA